MKRAIIVGATSGIGQEIAKVLLAQGWKIGIAGRRKELLTAFQERNPEQIATQALDVTQKDAVLKLNGLIEQLGGMDLFLLCQVSANRYLKKRTESGFIPSLYSGRVKRGFIP